VVFGFVFLLDDPLLFQKRLRNTAWIMLTLPYSVIFITKPMKAVINAVAADTV